MTDIDDAFDILLEEMESEIESMHQELLQTVGAKEYEKITAIAEKLDKLKSFLKKIEVLRREWNDLLFQSRSKKINSTKTRSSRRRLPRGVKTPQKAYYLPILKALDELGGSASVGSVLKKVEISMRDTFKSVDFEKLPSNQAVKRWENAAQWARNSLAREGLLKADSPHGTWEISELGRRELRKNP